MGKQVKGWTALSYYPYVDGYVLGTGKEPPNASATLTGNITFGGFDSRYTVGVSGVLIFRQDAVGGRTINWNGKVSFVSDSGLNLAANAVTIFDIVLTNFGWVGTKRGVVAVSGPPGPPGPATAGGTSGPAEVTASNAVTLSNKTLTNPNSVVQALLDSTTGPITWDANNGSVAYLTLNANRTLSVPINLKRGLYTLYVDQDATGSRTLTFATGYNMTGSVTLSTAANTRDVFWFVSDGSFMYGQLLYKGASTTAPAPTPAPTPAPGPTPAPPAGAPSTAPFYPFGSRLDLTGGAYPFGIMPTNFTASQMDIRIQNCYNAWKGARLKAAATFTPTSGIFNGTPITNGYYVDAAGTAGGTTVSEGHGYGMLILVIMAGYDANAKTYFDGMYRVARGRPAYGMPTTAGANQYLMEWTLINTTMDSHGGGYNATDGDMDIALALLMADRQWGSTGTINYRQQAINTIAAMKAVNFHSSGLMLAPQNVSRTSDYMIGHFRSYKQATGGDVFWDNARSASLSQIQNIVANFSPTAKLQPGFIYDPLGTPKPDNVARIDGSGIEDIYDSNAVRNPWRWGTDYVYSGDSAWGTITNNNVAWIKNNSGGDPNQTSFAYDLNGTPKSGLYYDPSTGGCIMVGAMVNSGNQAFLNACFNAASGGQFVTTYFNSELQLLPMLVASGNWWRPF